MKGKLWVLALGFLMVFSANPAWADGDFYVVVAGGGVGTKITSIPYDITKPGFYYLAGNLDSTTAEYAINIPSNDVTLDLMGFRLKGEVASFNDLHKGILIYGQNNVEIHNGTLTGWWSPIVADSGTDIRLINLRVQQNSFGIFLNGYNNLIKGCTISQNRNGIDITGSATICNNQLNFNGGCNISITGVGAVSGNTMSNSDTVLQFDATGSIIGNTITCDAGQTGIKIATDTSKRILLDQNTVGGAGTPYAGGSGATKKGTNAGF